MIEPKQHWMRSAQSGFATTGQHRRNKGLRVAALVAGLLTLASSAFCANWYVRPSATGANNGTDWNNAWSLSGIVWANVKPGDTIWLAGGSYYGQTLTVNGNGAAGSPIYIKRVLSSDAAPVAAPGWSASFDSQVVVDSGSGSKPPCVWPGGNTGLGNYVTIDGRIDSGIRFQLEPEGADYGKVGAVQVYTSYVHDITLMNIDMAGPGGASPYPYWGECALNLSSWTGAGYGSISNMLVSHCRLHGGADIINLVGVKNSTFEYCKMYDNVAGGGSTAHANFIEWAFSANITYRYNEVWNWSIEGFMVGAGTDDTTPDPIYIYGNVFRDAYWTAYTYVGHIISPVAKPSGQGHGPLYFFNNTCVNVPYAFGSEFSGGFWVSATIENNVYWNCAVGGAPGSVTQDYEFSNASVPGAHSISNAGQSPFMSLSPENFQLTSTSAARNAGVAISSPAGQTFNVDMNGNIRGADGAWDLGAFEYNNGANTNPIISVSPFTLSFGPVVSGKSVTNSFTVKNIGSGTLAGSVSLPANSAFKIVSGAAYSLGANQSQTVGISYSPSGSGTDSQTVTFTGGGGATATVTGSLLAVLPGLSFPSYAGVLSGPMATNSGGYIYETVDVSNQGQAGVTNGGQAVYCFNITSAGAYTVTAQVNAPNATSKSFWVNMDGQPTDPTMIWDVFPYTSGFESRPVSWRGNGSYTNDQYSPAVFNLSAGLHQLVIVGREPNVGLGQITIAPFNTMTNPPVAPPVVAAISQKPGDVDSTVAGVQAFAGSTVQYAGSASDPNGLALTWQWIFTVNGGAETVLQTGTGPVASVSYSYPANSGGSTYIWKLRVSNGSATAESALTVGAEPPPVPASGLTFQAPVGTLTAPFVATGGYISQPVETGVADGGQAVYSFTITNAGDYLIQALVNAPDTSANSFYVNIDAQPQDPMMVWDIPITSGFASRTASWRGNGTPDADQYAPKTFTLSAGTHQLIIVGREANTALQQVSILPVPQPPLRLRVVAGL